MPGQQTFTFAILGAGGRGNLFSQWVADHPGAGRVVAVAEPLAERRQTVGQRHNIPAEMQFERWEDLLAKPRLADVIINTTMDLLHLGSALQALDGGYHMLLEKPMAVTMQDCLAIDAARRRNNRIVSVCHSLRYNQFYTELKRLLDAGAIGRLISLDAVEGVEAIHQSHSFVRGNWGNESRSTFMLLSKSCHDMDIIAYLVGKPCRRVSSFGSLSHFKAANAPARAPKRCTDGCPAEKDCMYSALKIYLNEKAHWVSTHAGFAGKTHEQKMEMLRTGPYGRCVYHCDNDVVDHQVVNFEFEGDITGTFTMTAFDPGTRRIRLHGTEGYITGELTDVNTIDVYRFADHGRQRITIPQGLGGHGGGDSQVMTCLVHALRCNDPSAVLTGTEESLGTHAIAFAAERARREKRVVEVSELLPNPVQH